MRILSQEELDFVHYAIQELEMPFEVYASGLDEEYQNCLSNLATLQQKGKSKMFT